MAQFLPSIPKIQSHLFPDVYVVFVQEVVQFAGLPLQNVWTSIKPFCDLGHSGDMIVGRTAKKHHITRPVFGRTSATVAPIGLDGLHDEGITEFTGSFLGLSDDDKLLAELGKFAFVVLLSLSFVHLSSFWTSIVEITCPNSVKNPDLGHNRMQECSMVR